MIGDWTGCGECDPLFPCHGREDSEDTCIRMSKSEAQQPAHPAAPPSDTSRTDAIASKPWAKMQGADPYGMLLDLARTLERENAELRAQLATLAYPSTGTEPPRYLGGFCQDREKLSVDETAFAMLDKYPNLEAVFKGTISGNFRDWPAVRQEFRRFVYQQAEAALSALQSDREAAVRECAAVCSEAAAIVRKNMPLNVASYGADVADVADDCAAAILKLLEPK